MSILQLSAPPLPHYMINGITTTPAGRKHPNRRNIGVFDLLVVVEGCLYMGEEGQSYEVNPGQFLILRPDAHHYPTLDCQVDTTYYWLHFNALSTWSLIDEEGLASRSDQDHAPSIPDHYQFTERTFALYLPQYGSLAHPERMYELLQQMVELNDSPHQHDARLKQQMLFQQVLQPLSAAVQKSRSTPSSRCAEGAAAYLRKHYREEITAAAMGLSLNFHPVYIARCMQREFGCSPTQYLLRYRTQQAKLLLQQTDLPIARIAEEVGFPLPAYFTSCFKQFEGVTPRQYRKRFSS
ncbi:AraC family transcriptional regulator [Paenibacillus sp. GCM10023252]|uniref:AraC family transcriptional regulator n=1 Tax=Paenibacillus sp. GCM10023252 TaxID=3252649 RepID=UPI003607995C